MKEMTLVNEIYPFNSIYFILRCCCSSSIQFTVFKHRQMMYVSTWTYMDMSVFAIGNIIYKMQYSAPFEI